MIRSDYLLITLIILAFILAGTAQMMGILQEDFSLKIYVMPLMMASVFSIIVTRLRVIQRRHLFERNQREFAHAQIKILNARLSELLERRSELLSEAQDQVALAQTRADLGAMAAGVIHDINNALMATQMSWSLLENETDPQERETLNRDISLSLDQAFKITREFRSVLRPETTDAVEICSRVKSLVTFLTRSMKSNQRLNLRWGPLSSPLSLTPMWSPTSTGDSPPPQIQVNAALSEGQLTQILMNLIINARDALQDESGEVTVEVSSTTEEVQVSVTDNGVGMSPELQYKIFDPFFTTKPEGEGTGLGLHVIKQVVNRVGGELSLSSAEGVGSTFVITLPHSL